MKAIIILLAVVTSSLAATTLKCRFTRNTVFGYVCEISGVELLDVAEKLTIEQGEHMTGKTDADVKMITFTKSTVNVFPNLVFTTFPNIEILDLLDVKMTRWNRDFLKNAKNLKRIWLANNDLEELGDNSFLGATGLESLLLHNNKITKISDKAFNGLSQLKSLELQDNALTSLNGNVFAPLKKLKELNLGKNQIVKIDGEVFESNSKLEFLNLDHNNITFLAGNTFKNQQNLTIIYLQNNQLEKISTDLFTTCSTLMELRLDNNQLKEIPLGVFENNKKFKLINIMNNLIENFDGKVLPEGMELLYIDESVNTVNMPEKLEVFRAEKHDASNWTDPEGTKEFTTAKE